MLTKLFLVLSYCIFLSYPVFGNFPTEDFANFESDFKDLECPEQIHISFGESTNSIVVTWSTFQDTADTIVRYQIDSLLEGSPEICGTSTKFTDGGDMQSVQYIHRVTLEDLEYNATYFYKAGSYQCWSKEYYFQTPLENEKEWVLRAAIFGDMGLTQAFSRPFLIDDTKRGMYDLIIHNGDIAYDMADLDGTTGDNYLNNIEPMAAIVPYMTSVGNHEAAYNFSHYTEKFSMPNYEDTKSLYFSYNIGKVHFIAISTEYYYYDSLAPGVQAQYNWLLQDLEQASKTENRKKYPWIIIYGHKPMYCSNSDKECVGYESYREVKKLEPLLNKYGVDIAFWAHEHSYERCFPVYDFNVYNGSDEKPYVNPRAPVHIISGAGGGRELLSPFNEIINSWSAFRSEEFGYTRFWAYNETHIHMQQIAVPMEGTNTNIIDDFWIIQDNHGPFNLE